MLQQGGHVVGAGDLRPAPRCSQGRVPRACCDVKDSLTGMHVQRAHEQLANDQMGDTDAVEVPRGPHQLLAPGDFTEMLRHRPSSTIGCPSILSPRSHRRVA